MSRAGYTDDQEQWRFICWRGAVASAIRGRRGQAFLRELRDALEGLQYKRVIKEELSADGNVCALGAVAKWRNLDVTGIDENDHDNIQQHFCISNALAREIIWENDESYPYPKTEEERWRKMRWWVESKIIRESKEQS